MTDPKPHIDLRGIEEQLINNGAFHPINYLLDQGWLAFDDYEAWRHNQLPVLETRVLLPPGTLAQLLRQAEALARQLHLAPRPQVFHSWEQNESRPLVLSQREELARRLAQTWVREDALPQLDMFMDSAATAAENDLASALVARQWDQAESDYAKLSRQAPSHARLGHYEILVLYGKHLDAGEPACEEDVLEEEIAGLEADIAPLARELLRERARDFLAPAWRRLARALRDLPFDPARPRLHASYAWSQLPHWPKVIAAVTAEHAHQDHFVLLQRLAQAQFHGHAPEQHLLTWCRLFELDIQTAQAAAEHGSPPPLARLWSTFSDREPALPAELFPAWLALHAPGLAAAARNPELPLPGSAAFTAALALRHARQRQGHEMQARNRLQDASPALLRDYLASL